MTSTPDPDRSLTKSGTLLIRTLTMPADANLNGGVFGGWILAELDKAAGLIGMRRAGGACATVAIEAVTFQSPLRVGEDFQVYGEVVATGRTSMRLELEGWASPPHDTTMIRRVVRGIFTSVALDDTGRPRQLPEKSSSDTV